MWFRGTIWGAGIKPGRLSSSLLQVLSPLSIAPVPLRPQLYVFTCALWPTLHWQKRKESEGLEGPTPEFLPETDGKLGP